MAAPAQAGQPTPPEGYAPLAASGHLLVNLTAAGHKREQIDLECPWPTVVQRWPKLTLMRTIGQKLAVR